MKIMLYCGIGSVIHGTGGMEHVLCNMANAMLRRGHQVCVVCNESGSGRPFFPLDEQVDLVNIGLMDEEPEYRPRNHLVLKIAREILHPLQKLPFFNQISNPLDVESMRKVNPKLSRIVQSLSPDVIVCYSIHDAACLMYPFRKEMATPVVIMHHFNPDVVLLKVLKTALGRLTYAKCAHLQVLLPEFAKEVRQKTGCEAIVIPNAVPQVPDDTLADLLQEKNEYRILMTGRIDFHHKRQDFLVRSFARIARKYPDWKLEIYGSCSRQRYRGVLEQLIRENSMEDQVRIMEPVEHVFDLLRTGDIFAFPTAFEGFGLSLTEAMSAGLPCIGLKTTPAVNSLIIEGVNGFLTDNSEASFARQLEVLMQDRALRVQMGRAGHEMVKQYAPDVVWDTWDQLFRETLAGSGCLNQKVCA